MGNGGQDLALFGSHFYVAEMKGTKGYTKVVGRDDLGGSMKKSIEELKIEFPFLDWDYMLDPMQGEFVCDVGITFHANSHQPLVGLWRLDRLEASFGAGGYYQGNLHRLNTLSCYGGLQAEQPEGRKARTQVVFRSTYNLAYEVTRKMNNKRDLFSEKDLYHTTDHFFEDCKRVISLYRQHSSQLSYGVRDEFRVGGRALIPLMGSIDEMVSIGQKKH